MMKRTPLLAVVLAAGIPAVASAATARAQLPSQLAVGTPAQLSITVDDNAKPPDVRIPDAQVRFTGQMQQTSIVNGNQTQALTFLYTVVPDKTGPLDIPPISVATAHGPVATAPVHATVAKAPAASSMNAATGATGGPATTASSAPAARATNLGSQAFVRMQLPKKQLVVGEAVPVTIRAYFRGGTSATLEGQPHLDSDAFTLSQLSDKPAQTEVEIRGERYLQATWTGVLSPAKPSSHPLAVELPVDLAYRVRVQRPQQHRTLRDVFGGDPFADAFGSDAFGGDPFADSFFDQEDPFADMFDEGTVQEQHADLKGSVGTVKVDELPAAGRPAGFTGAVGSFAIAMDPPAGDARVGEPMKVTIHVTGTGNFDRVAIGGIAPSAQLKTYDLKSAFAAGGKPLTGDKTFTQTVVPTRAGALELPAVELAYFDPGKHAYVVAKTSPVTVQVAPGVATPGLASTVRDPDMSPNRLSPGEMQATLAPLAWRRGFWALPGGLVLLTALLAGAGVWRRSHERTRRANAQAIDRAVGAAREEMHEAAERGDRAAFFSAARNAVQQRLGAVWGIAPEAVTTSDVAARNPDPELLALLEHADRVTYAGDSATEPLDRWCALADRQLAHLEAP